MILFDFISFLALTGTMAVISHEWGHYHTLKNYGREVKIKLTRSGLEAGTQKDYEGLNKKQLKNIYLNGILTGAITIIIMSTLYSPLYFLLLIPYLVACKSDIKNYLNPI